MKKIYRLMPLVLIGCVSFCPLEMNEASVQPENEKLAVSNKKTDSTKAIALNDFNVENVKSNLELTTESIYKSIQFESLKLPSYKSFSKAFAAYYELEQEELVKNPILTVIDFGLSSTEKRLWVIDMENRKVLIHSLVSHGLNSGEEYATNFSNTINSYQSSLGTFLTGETYNGKHGFSMRLDGVEQNINNNARDRAVVVHAADYVSESFIAKHGRLGRSQGCPAIPANITKELIELIKEKSVLFIYHPQLDSKTLDLNTTLFS